MESHLRRLINAQHPTTPIVFLRKLNDEVQNNLRYYAKFKTFNGLLHGIAKKVIDKKLYDFHKNKWVTMI